MGWNSTPAARRQRATESFKAAADCIGTIEPGMSVFAVTRGQFSMVDAIMVCLDQAGPSDVSMWTWTTAEYDIACVTSLLAFRQVTDGTLIIDPGVRAKNPEIIRMWREAFGEQSVRYVKNHAKMATVRSAKYTLLLRGSLNLNYNPRFEQFDVTEGGPDFDLVRRIESELPILSDDATGAEVYRASKVREAFDLDPTAKIFDPGRVWAK